MNFNFIPAIKILRPINVIITFFASVVASFMCLNGQAINTIYYAAMTAALTSAAGNIINDIVDIEGDKTNHPKRVLPSGKLLIKTAVSLYIVLTGISLIISIFLSNILFVVNAAVTLLLILYSFYFKKQPLVGNIIVSMLTGCVFIYGGLAVNNFYYSLLPASFAFLINLIREIVKDIEDMEGDIKEGVITFPSKFGINKTRLLLTFLSLILIASSLYPIIAGTYNYYYGDIVIIFIDPLILYFIWKINVNGKNLSLNNISFLLKLNMILGLIAIYIGR